MSSGILASGTIGTTTFPSVNKGLPTNAYWNAVTYGNGTFVAIAGNNTNIAATSDGITWTQRTLPAAVYWSSVTYGNGVFVAIAGAASSTNIAATSSDGITWTQRTLPTSAAWCSVTYGNGTFVAISGGGGNTTIAATSSDGITWTQRTLPVAYWNAVTYGNGTFVAIAGNANTIAATSSDGITWTQRTLPTNTYWNAVTYGNGVFVAIAGGNNTTNIAATSSDGITWTQRTLPASTWSSVTYGNGTFVAISGSSSNIATHITPAFWNNVVYTAPATKVSTGKLYVSFSNYDFPALSTAASATNNYASVIINGLLVKLANSTATVAATTAASGLVSSSNLTYNSLSFPIVLGPSQTLTLDTHTPNANVKYLLTGFEE